MNEPEKDYLNWLITPIRREDIGFAATVTMSWVGFIGFCIAASRTTGLMTGPFGVKGSCLTTLVAGIGYFTVHYWFLSIPFWGAAFIGSSLWALRVPEKRRARLSTITFVLSVGMGLAAIGIFIPVAQWSHSIAAPPLQPPAH